MADKEYYKMRILAMKPYINIASCCRATKINRMSLHNFLYKDVNSLSVESLKRFVDFIEGL